MRSATLSLLLLSTLGLSFAGCDSSDDESTTTAAATEGGTGVATSGPSTGDDTGSNETGDATGSAETGSAETGSAETGDATGGGGNRCVYLCSSDDDCLSGGNDIGLSCTDNGACIVACEVAEDCIPVFSGWSAQPCDSNDACGAGPCIDLGDGTGGCGTEPSEFLACADFMQSEVTVNDIDGNPVTVCGNDSGICTDLGDGNSACTLEAATDCAEAGCPDGFTCGDEGICLCDNDDACEGDLTCGSDGFCENTCSDASECTDALPFDGGEYACQ